MTAHAPRMSTPPPPPPALGPEPHHRCTAQVAFDAIRAALDIPATAVESWVVRAIGAKLMDGKIDQVRGCGSCSWFAGRALRACVRRHTPLAICMSECALLFTARTHAYAHTCTHAYAHRPAAPRPPQVHSKVVISRCVQRTFGLAEWASLRDQLAAWRDSMHGAHQLCSSLHSSAASGPAGAQGGKPAIAAAL